MQDMQKDKNHWENFLKTGKVTDYLIYKNEQNTCNGMVNIKEEEIC